MASEDDYSNALNDRRLEFSGTTKNGCFEVFEERK